MKQVMQLLLTPDGSASRRVRRLLAEQSARSGVVVGTWPELIEHAKSAYLTAHLTSDWEQCFRTALEEITDAFWAESLTVSPQDTALAIQESLSLLVAATEPCEVVTIGDSDKLPGQPRKYIQDIVRLLRILDGRLPDSLSAIKNLLIADAEKAIRHIHVYRVDGIQILTRWQMSLIEKLNSDAGIEVDEKLRETLNQLLSESGGAEKQTSLAALQGGLFLPSGNKATFDETVQWLGVRDFLEEAEVAVGVVQSVLNSDHDLKPSDVGLLVPDSFEYSLVVEEVFSAAGLPISGLPVDHWKRDLGREAVFHFLYCRQKPAPAMALAVCLSSALMPWSREEGAVLAQAVMDGDYRLRPFHSAAKDARNMLDLLRGGDDQPQTLTIALYAFVSLLDDRDEFAVHVYQAKVAAENVCVLLEGLTDIDWVSLRRVSTPKDITTAESPDFNLEGVTLWREGHEPWRKVRYLMVLGFASGNYPITSATSPVFVADDLDAIREHLDLPVITPADELKERRARFKRQLAAVSEFVSFLVPRRDPNGAAQAPSESLVFMHQLFDGFDEAEDLILELDAKEDRENVRYLSSVQANEAESPRNISSDDIRFDCDLLSLRTDADGNLRPESPSSLETLMVSPLAWLLRRLNAEPLGWAPERANVMLLGTLAHQVFEELFQSGRAWPEIEAITTQVGPLLDEAIRQHGPFLRAAQWQVERMHLAAGITKAALAWRAVLEALGAEILGSEEWLEGKLDGISIHGQADVLLGLSAARLLVVDYKRSGANSRRPRMQKGFDSQASLYRTMLQTGGPKERKNHELTERLRTARQTGIVYFMLNDQTALSDALLVESGEIPGWEVIDGDIAGLAIGLIKKRLREVKSGLLCLNREGDAVFFEKTAGVKPYALENSPLIPLFTMPGEAMAAE